MCPLWIATYFHVSTCSPTLVVQSLLVYLTLSNSLQSNTHSTMHLTVFCCPRQMTKPVKAVITVTHAPNGPIVTFLADLLITSSVNRYIGDSVGDKHETIQIDKTILHV
ncbi:hypothetical protein B0T17DRAFT_99134 [Bombardia bombarda]|uniref:Secreted protein n=1 Tax=Bombardia bombarda TaxID=252184 RepID=A0AA40CG94_9PEZI|nr:hypothetical protein B0T17DRAFT_99134 [Bombardia bombarda]